MITKFRRNKRLIFGIFLGLTIFLFLINEASISFSQRSADPFRITNDFIFFDFGEDYGEMLNVSSIEFSLPSSSWNITNIEFNFTNIKPNREIIPVEYEDEGFSKRLYKGTQGYAVQINITETTKIYGVHIYAQEISPATTTDVTVQINGYSSITEKPNETIYGSTLVNMTSNLKWYKHNFSNPFFLNPGIYSLILNGTEMTPSDSANYYWHYNILNPRCPNLLIWEYDGNWQTGITGEPFLYKLDQKIIGEFYPKDINMTAEINEQHYSISDGNIPGTGLLNKSLIISSSDQTIPIPITNNISNSLSFNLSYHIHLKNNLTCNAEGIREYNDNKPNKWLLTPDIERHFHNHSIQFNYPDNWYNFTVLRKTGLSWENITSYCIIDINNNILFLPDKSIIDGAEWLITANSPNIAFSIDLPVSEWNPGQELQFTVTAPIVEGNLTFFFINSLGYGYDEPIEEKKVTSSETLFTHTIESNSREGSYQILIYWNNDTDAGFQSQTFVVIIPPIPFTIDPIWIVIGIIIASVGVTGGLLSYRTIKNFRNRKIEEQQKLFNKCMDVLNLLHVIVSDKKSGLNIYQQDFTEKNVDAAMISGFLQAIHSFGIELIKIEDSSQTIKLEYKESIIIMTEFVNIRLILLMKEHPSLNFLYALEDLAYDLYKFYGEMIDQFNGDIKPFKSIEKLLKHHLNTSITYPLKLTELANSDKLRINPTGRTLISKARSIMKKRNSNTFYLTSLLPEKECGPKDLEAILNLIDKNIIQIIE
ncbi:MAG: hypothetical protein ACFFE5_12515 [Candidatus Thorarchaeota archaeon]